MRSGTIGILATTVLTGCVSLGGDPLLAAMTTTPAPLSCGDFNAGEAKLLQDMKDDADGKLCASLRNVAYFSASLKDSATQLDNTQVGLGGTQILGALATIGFAAFEAHPDNSLTAALVGGSAFALNDGLKPAAKRDILRSSLRSLNCTVERGSVFLGAAGKANALETSAAQTAIFGVEVRTKRPPNTGTPEDQKLDAALIRLDHAVVGARAAMNAARNAPTQIYDTRRLIEVTIERKLAALQPDYAAIANAISKVPPKSPASDAPAPEQPDAQRSDEIKKPFGGLVAPSDKGVFDKALLAAVVDEAAGLLEAKTGPGEAEFKAVAQCAAEST